MHDPPSASTNGAPLVSPAIAPASSTTNGPLAPSSVIQKLNSANEQTWLLIGRVAEQMGDLEHALSAYENALRHNPMSLSGLTQVAGIARIKENYPKVNFLFPRVPETAGFLCSYLLIPKSSIRSLLSYVRLSSFSSEFSVSRKTTAKSGAPLVIVISCRMTFKKHMLHISRLFISFLTQRKILNFGME